MQLGTNRLDLTVTVYDEVRVTLPDGSMVVVNGDGTISRQLRGGASVTLHEGTL
jgi:hypothetical protein